MRITWDSFDIFQPLIDKYMPACGEGETKASQIVTACNKLVYKWYNDGDVYDNTYHLSGWWNDLSSYANWLFYHTDADLTLQQIAYCTTAKQYEELLFELCKLLLQEDALQIADKKPKQGSIYDASGPFTFKE